MMCARSWLSTGVCVVWLIGKTAGDCSLPEHPAHGRHQPQGGDCGGAERHSACDGTPNTLAPEDWLLTVRCDPGYQLPDPEAADVPSVCINGAWSISHLPQCVIPDLLTNDRERCTVPEPPPNSQFRLLAEECGRETLPPGSAVPHDCILFLNCAPGYHRRIGSGDLLTHCTNKTWNPQIPDELCTREVATDTRPPVSSTEEPPKKPPVISVDGCELPKPSPSRKFCSLAAGCEDCDIYHRQCFVPPGSKVDKVRIVCAPGHSIRSPYGGDIAVCLPNGWYPPIPECLKLCHPLVSEDLLLRCRLGTDIVNCSKPALPGTTASFQCLPSFSEYPDLKRQGAYRNIITCSSSGEWSDNLPPCKAGCGVSREVKKFRPTIYNGQEAHIGFFPWHAGLYYPMEDDGKITWDQRCGGSLITDQVVITAAHCVSGVANVSDLRIALGKYFRSWDTYEPTEEKRSVLAITFPSQYNKATFTFDVALVLLNEKIRFGEYIMPVCRDFEEGTNELRNTNLYVVGWGKTDEQIGALSSSKLLYNTVAALSDSECRRAVPVFYSTFEKFCGVKNISGVVSESATQGGDSGGGLTAVYKDGLHYIVGIVSTKLERTSLFTNIKWKTHTDWIDYEIRQFKTKYSS